MNAMTMTSNLYAAQPVLRSRLILAGQAACEARAAENYLAESQALAEIDKITDALARIGLVHSRALLRDRP